MLKSSLTAVAFAAAAALLALAPAADASVSLVTSSAALGANDTIDWSQLGPTFTVLSSPQAFTSTGGVMGSVSSAGGVFERRDQNNGWAGNFAPGTALLWDQGAGPDITLTFATPVFGAGAQIQADFFGAFTAVITTTSGSFSENGFSNSNADGSAIFIGVLSTMPDITSIEFTLSSASNAPNDFAIGPVSLNTNGATVPEPAAWTMMILGMAGVGFAARRRKGALATV